MMRSQLAISQLLQLAALGTYMEERSSTRGSNSTWSAIAARIKIYFKVEFINHKTLTIMDGVVVLNKVFTVTITRPTSEKLDRATLEHYRRRTIHMIYPACISCRVLDPDRGKIVQLNMGDIHTCMCRRSYQASGLSLLPTSCGCVRVTTTCW